MRLFALGALFGTAIVLVTLVIVSGALSEVLTIPLGITPPPEFSPAVASQPPKLPQAAPTSSPASVAPFSPTGFHGPSGPPKMKGPSGPPPY
jgi:hypothetical protein